jgi:hypothetical protein
MGPSTYIRGFGKRGLRGVTTNRRRPVIVVVEILFGIRKILVSIREILDRVLTAVVVQHAIVEVTCLFD